MLKFKREQRALLADTLRDIANVAAGAMVFGQFLGGQRYSLWVALGGVCLWIVLVACAIVLTDGTHT